MNTREWMSDFISTQPKTKVGKFVGLVLEELFARQTEAEKASDTTQENNTIGFTAFDARSGSQDAKAFAKYGTLSGFRVNRWTRKNRGVSRICKYHGQINQKALEAKLASIPSTPERDKLSEARQEYARIRGLFYSGSGIFTADFDSAVKAKIEDQASPEKWVETAKTMSITCGRCSGTGKYVTMVVNGKPTGPGGDCFRCEGKGTQTYSDALRNWGYDRYGRKVY